MNTCELIERAGWIFPKKAEVICLGRPLARRQQKLIVPAGRRICGRPQTRAGRGSDAGETQLGRICGRDAARTRLRAPADAGGTHLGRVSDAVFDKLFVGGTVPSISDKSALDSSYTWCLKRNVEMFWAYIPTPSLAHPIQCCWFSKKYF